MATFLPIVRRMALGASFATPKMRAGGWVGGCACSQWQQKMPTEELLADPGVALGELTDPYSTIP